MSESHGDAASSYALPDMPKLTSPTSETEPHPLHDPIVWELFDADVPFTSIRLQRSDGTFPWNIDSGPNTTSVTIPAPPSTVDGADLSYFIEQWLTGCP